MRPLLRSQQAQGKPPEEKTLPPPGGADPASQLALDALQTRPDAKAGTRLTAAEREVVLTIADDEEGWHVYTDSARLTGLLLRFSRRHGIPVKQIGGGYEFDLPRNAVRIQMRRGPSAATVGLNANAPQVTVSFERPVVALPGEPSTTWPAPLFERSPSAAPE